MKKITDKLINIITAGRDLRNPGERFRIAMIEGWSSVSGNLFLAIIKFIFGFISGSISLIADAVHTASDIVSSATVLIGFKISKKSLIKNILSDTDVRNILQD